MAALTAGALTLSACGSPTPSALTSARLAASTAHSVVVTDTATVLGATSTLSGFIGPSTASVTWTDGSLGSLSLTSCNAHLYVRGTEAMLARVLHFDAHAQRVLDGGTVDLVAGDAPYASLSAMVSLSGILTPFIATGHRSTSTIHRPGGISTTVVTGSITLPNGWSGIASLTMDRASSLPTFGLLEVSNGSQRATRSAHFTDWGTTAYAVDAPSTSVPYSTLVTS